MQSKIDIKSMVLGAALGVGIMLSVAAATTQNSSSGRYQLVVSDNYTFKIDTETGRVWTAFTSSPSKAFLLAPAPVEKPAAEKPEN